MKKRKEGDFLLFDGEWFERAREMSREDPVFRAMAAELRRRCEQVLDPADPMFLDPQDTSSPWWKTRPATKQLVVYTLDLSLAGRLFREERFSAAAAAVLETLAGRDMAEKGEGTSYGKPYRKWFANALDAGHAGEALGLAFDLLGPSIGPVSRKAVADCLGEKFLAALVGFRKTGANVYGAPGLSGREDLNFQNIPMIGRISAGVLAAALEGSGARNPAGHLAAAREAALEYLDNGGHEEGILPEGPMYGFAVLKHIAVLGTVLARRGDPSIWETDSWDRIVEAYCSQSIPCDGSINPLNDCYEVRVTAWLPAVARFRKNGLARWLWESIVRPLDEGRWDSPAAWDSMFAPWWNACLPLAMAVLDPSVPPVSPGRRRLPATRYFAVRGVADFRGGWRGDDWLLSITCCPDIRWRNRRHFMHAQADRGHFSLYALGEKFAVDNGYGNEFLSGTTEVHRLGLTGEAHNIPEIHGTMQRPSTHAGGFRYLRPGGPVDAAMVSFPETYRDCGRLDRKFLLVRDGRGRPLYLVVHDSIFPVSPARGTFGLLLHTEAGNRVEIRDRERAVITGHRKGNRCHLLFTAQRPGALSSDEFLGHPRLRFRVSGSILHALTVIVPCEAGETPPEFERSDPDNEEGFSVRLAFRGCRDTLLCCLAGTVADRETRTDAELLIAREKGSPGFRALVEGSFLEEGGVTFYQEEKRADYILLPGA